MQNQKRTGKVTNATKGSSSGSQPGGLYIGVCKRLSANGPYISIPNLSPGAVFGPCKVSGLYPIVGSLVVCMFLEDRLDEVVILGRLIASNVINSTGEPVVPTDVATKNYVDSQIISLQAQITALRTRYNSHVAHPPPA